MDERREGPGGPPPPLFGYCGTIDPRDGADVRVPIRTGKDLQHMEPMSPNAEDACATRADKRELTLGEEIANAVTHGAGIALALIGLVVLVSLAAVYGNIWHIASCAVYGTTLVLLYTASTLYHSMPAGSTAKHVFKIIDHSSIYLLIAGTYTPFTLVTLRGPWGWSLFITVWVLAIAGVSLEAFWVMRPKWLSAIVYLAMGWLVVVAIKPLMAALPAAGLALLVAGGLAYTIGCVFYVQKRVPYMHMVWHLFVLAGSVLHFFAVMLYVLP